MSTKGDWHRPHDRTVWDEGYERAFRKPTEDLPSPLPEEEATCDRNKQSLAPTRWATSRWN